MKSFLLTLATVLMLVPSFAIAHEMIPTYPKLRVSHLENLYVTTMQMFNKRVDVEFYEIDVLDKYFNPIPFVSTSKVINLKHLEKITFDVYIRKEDAKRAMYICSSSKLSRNNTTRTAISSKICSKIE
jgi:hypothetical protein